MFWGADHLPDDQLGGAHPLSAVANCLQFIYGQGLEKFPLYMWGCQQLLELTAHVLTGSHLNNMAASTLKVL